MMRSPVTVSTRGSCLPSATNAERTALMSCAYRSAGTLFGRGKTATLGTSIHSMLTSGNGPNSKLSTKACGAWSHGKPIACTLAPSMNLIVIWRRLRVSLLSAVRTARHLLFDMRDAENDRLAVPRSRRSSSERFWPIPPNCIGRAVSAIGIDTTPLNWRPLDASRRSPLVSAYPPIRLQKSGKSPTSNNTSRRPTWSGVETTPSFSIRSISRAPEL